MKNKALNIISLTRPTAYLFAVILLLFGILILIVYFVIAKSPAKTPHAASRDPLQWPFAANSIWNLPIGSGAVYKAANIKSANYLSFDEDIIVAMPNAPVKHLFLTEKMPGTCDGSKYHADVPVPDDLVLRGNSNNASSRAGAFVLADGHSLVQTTSVARCTGGADVFSAYAAPNDDIISGVGTLGGHAGSGLSSIGGSIRKGELLAANKFALGHALKVNLNNPYFAFGKGGSCNTGHRWPAVNTDSYANGSSSYTGNNDSLCLGSLLAIPPQYADNIVTTDVGKKLFHALQDYGAYIVDDTYWDANTFVLERGVAEEVAKDNGFIFETNDKNSASYKDAMALFSALSIVDNWSDESYASVAASQGAMGAGGGIPRVSWAPSFSTNP